MKYTKGPWKVCTEETSVYSPSEEVIVHTADLGVDPSMGPQTGDEEFANARLIAAAPEMYEVLKKLESMSRDKHDGAPLFFNPIPFIRDAIKKAEGRK